MLWDTHHASVDFELQSPGNSLGRYTFPRSVKCWPGLFTERAGKVILKAYSLLPPRYSWLIEVVCSSCKRWNASHHHFVVSEQDDKRSHALQHLAAYLYRQSPPNTEIIVYCLSPASATIRVTKDWFYNHIWLYNYNMVNISCIYYTLYTL